MNRLLALSTIILACLSARAEAVEMFTDFHNGENVGFPPMQVPYGIYGGLGRGGWNPTAEGMPLKTWPPVPAMMPTQQIPGGFRRCNNCGNGNGQANNAAASSSNHAVADAGHENFDGNRSESDGPSLGDSYSNSSSRNAVPQALVSDRRHNNHWQSNDGFNSQDNENVSKPSGAVRDSQAGQNGVSRQKMEPALTLPTGPTILHAVDGEKPPESSDIDLETEPGSNHR
jgi:hypothetical protein